MSFGVSSERERYVGLNVGGKVYQTSLANLTRYANTFFSPILDGVIPSVKDKHGNFIIDRDGKMFRHILNFLRNGELVLPEGFNEFKLLEMEADFFLIEEMKDALREKRRERKITIKPDLIGFTIKSIPRIYKLELRHVLREPNSVLSKWISGDVLLPVDHHGNFIMEDRKRDVNEDTYLRILNYLQKGFITKAITASEAERLKVEAKYYELELLESHVRSVQQVKFANPKKRKPIGTPVVCNVYYYKEKMCASDDQEGPFCIAYSTEDLSSSLPALQVAWVSTELLRKLPECHCFVVDLEKISEKKPARLENVISYFQTALGEKLGVVTCGYRDGWIEQTQINASCTLLRF